MPAILAFLGSAVAKIFTDKVIGFLAMKAIATFLFVIILPILLNNFIYDIIEIVGNFASQQVGGSGFNGAMSFTGFAAWLMLCFKIPESIAVLVGAMTLRVALSMIPFVRF